MPKFIDLTGDRYGRLTVLEYVGVLGQRTSWLCRCDCGNEVVVKGNSLRTGSVKSCGCYNNELRALRAKTAGSARGKQMLKHGFHGERLYGVWRSMRQRCNNPNCSDYSDYGARGISVCQEWDSYLTFRNWSYQSGYDENAPFGKCTLDRIDNSKGYSPSNCRWVDLKTQANNRRPRRCSEKCK